MATATATAQMPGFVFAEKLGSGSYATVYKAYSKGSKRQVVAVKCIEKSTLSKPATENLLMEISILKMLKHEHIVEMKDFVWDENYIYIIMEFCSGGDLSTFIKTRRSLSEKIVKRFLQQLASALKYIRSKNIAHMDLKPQNILLTSLPNPVLKVADFGFAQYLKPKDDATALRGSPLYMAPEILLKQTYDARADLWSVGVILYECLFGKAPYSSQTFSELAKKIMNPTPIKIPYGVEISDECRDLLLKLLLRDPDKRISFEEFFMHPFIDLEHMPSNLSYDKAVQVVTKAVLEDKAGNYAEAVNLYCQSLQHFVSAIEFEKDLERKDAMRLKAKEYLARAEEIKCKLKPMQPASTLSKDDAAMKELVSLSMDTAPMLAALKVGEVAEELENYEKYALACEKYELALGTLLPLLAVEPKGKRKELLHNQVGKWLKKAENIKDYLKIPTYPIEDASVSNGRDAVGESIRQQCCIQ